MSNRFSIGMIVIVINILAGCKVMLIGAYDQVTDQNIQKIQNEVSTLLVGVEKNIQNNQTGANSYDSLKNSFISIEGDLKSTIIRCNSLPKYKIVTGQLNSLQNNVNDFEKYSKLGLDVGGVRTADSIFQVQFTAITTLQNALKSQK